METIRAIAESAVAFGAILVVGIALGLSGIGEWGRGRRSRRGRGGGLGSLAARLATGGRIEGEARVVDGDGLRINGVMVRMIGIDAPEYRQPAVTAMGKHVNHGAVAKSALHRKIAGRPVSVKVTGKDRFGRVLGVVFCEGEDLNAWMVRQGFAMAFMSDRYRREHENARWNRAGMWSYCQAWSPAAWKRGRRESIFRRGVMSGLFGLR